MSKENAAASELDTAKEEKSGLRIAQVLAAALAAVTAALLGSTLGVAGTVVGAGVASVVSTVGSELYLRSLQRTREAALKARQLATSGIRRRGPAEPGEIPITDQPTVQLAKPEPSRLRKLRWPLIIGTSVAAFAVAILAIVGFESATGTQIGGGTGTGIGKIFGNGGGQTDKTPSTTPSTSTDTQVSPTESTTTPSDTSTAPTTTSETPTTTPSTTAQQPSTSAPATTTAPTSKGAATTPTP
ncbi:hypothetical protein SAMN05421837_1112 [Amycolatopsis pretoriensis]|uniref:Uncharacterized protein n=1 Tax=Amycolatopsis pretoriensis TaxID=218821 RepID=A0A1H5RDY7_9PSEU|nr:hypothetical protein [Amycolatopsis pretoriensis]SEF36583.1 hypothetical protein SAMN05421837_1112 [Amycolatopsis pretoriensis]